MSDKRLKYILDVPRTFYVEIDELFDGPTLDEAIEYLQSIKPRFKEACDAQLLVNPNATPFERYDEIRLELDNYGDGYDLSIRCLRFETNDEEAERQLKEESMRREREAKMIESEKEMYEKLKAKYGSIS